MQEEFLKLARLDQEQRELLPGYVQRLINGYELRTWWFEIFECGRKLAVACVPVFFQPSGSVSQLIFGLVVCFLTFGTHMLCAPYVDNADDRLAQLCQVQIFFALLSSLLYKKHGVSRFHRHSSIQSTLFRIYPIALQ